MKPLNQYENSLVELGLSPDQARVYSVLLDGGLVLGKYVVSKSELKKGLVYKVLDQLISIGLVEKKDRGSRAALFSPAHPRVLQKFIDNQKQKLKLVEENLDSAMGSMISKYNLLSGKPNVQFFEGEEAVKKIIGDYPENDKEIRQWIDMDVALKEIKTEVKEYLDKRIKRGISKRMILPKNQTNVGYIKEGSEMTEFRLQEDIKTLPTAIQVYDNTLVMLTLEKDKKIGLLIEDSAIANTMKVLFDSTWSRLNPLEE